MRCLPRLAVLALASALVAGCGTTESADRQAGAAEAAAPAAPADFGHVHGLGGLKGDLIIATHNRALARPAREHAGREGRRWPATTARTRMASVTGVHLRTSSLM